MKLVLTYQISDGCTYSNDLNIPFEYESKEKAEYDLYAEWERVQREELTETVYKKKNEPKQNASKEKWNSYWDWMPKINNTLKLGNITDLNVNDFTKWTDWGEKYLGTKEYDEPSILTLDEWFDKNKQ
jgi:hypothetical protein